MENQPPDSAAPEDVRPEVKASHLRREKHETHLRERAASKPAASAALRQGLASIKSPVGRAATRWLAIIVSVPISALLAVALAPVVLLLVLAMCAAIPITMWRSTRNIKDSEVFDGPE